MSTQRSGIVVWASALLFLFLNIIFLSGCDDESQKIKLHFSNTQNGLSAPDVLAEVAETPSKRQLGLMYRKSLPDDGGMLFIFPDEIPRTFWMKNTYLELDMIFFDSDFQVVSVVEKAIPLTESHRDSGKPAKYVLEVRGGSAARWGIVPGVKANPESPLPSAQ